MQPSVAHHGTAHLDDARPPPSLMVQTLISISMHRHLVAAHPWEVLGH
jgi:hypothetical protein